VKQRVNAQYSVQSTCGKGRSNGREFISVIAGSTSWPLVARAQQPAMPVIGYLAGVPEVTHLTAAFRRGIAELGYVEGKNFAACGKRLERSSKTAASSDTTKPPHPLTPFLSM
jgi:hypothetical protein